MTRSDGTALRRCWRMSTRYGERARGTRISQPPGGNNQPVAVYCGSVKGRSVNDCPRTVMRTMAPLAASAVLSSSSVAANSEVSPAFSPVSGIVPTSQLQLRRNGCVEPQFNRRLDDPHRVLRFAVEDERGQRSGGPVMHQLEMRELVTELHERAAVRRFVLVRRDFERRAWFVRTTTTGTACDGCHE
jgi:hypothetical protein